MPARVKRFGLVHPGFGHLDSQVEVMIEENEDVLSILDPRQGLVPLIGPMHCETRGVPLLLLGVGEGGRSLHDNMKQLITLLGDSVLREGIDQLNRSQSAVGLFGGRSRVPEHLSELFVDPGDLRAAFVTVRKKYLVSCERQGTNSTHLFSTTNESSMCNLIPKTNQSCASSRRRSAQEREVSIEGSEERILLCGRMIGRLS